ncbi:MAG TPA: hypothetical protein V6D17_05390 [Candidatus Obscuribacterales bacterium]
MLPTFLNNALAEIWHHDGAQLSLCDVPLDEHVLILAYCAEKAIGLNLGNPLKQLAELMSDEDPLKALEERFSDEQMGEALRRAAHPPAELPSVIAETFERALAAYDPDLTTTVEVLSLTIQTHSGYTALVFTAYLTTAIYEKAVDAVRSFVTLYTKNSLQKVMQCCGIINARRLGFLADRMRACSFLPASSAAPATVLAAANCTE